MKKRFLVLTAALMLTLTATFARDNKSVPATIVTELNQQFTSASDVQWETTANFYKASFNIDGQSLRAFYDIDGKMLGVSRNITVGQLPLVLIKEVKEKSAAGKVTDLFELLTDRGTEYYITYQGDKDTKTFMSTGEYWTRY